MQDPRYDELREMLGANADIKENGEGDTREALKRLSREDYERFGLHKNYTPPSTVNKKKRKAKTRQQKQSRKRSRR
ncbi:MAG: hypothetical protein K6F89_07550 [Prevotella sp.]|nr:hypothetical protein [Prevotella sp.]